MPLSCKRVSTHIKQDQVLSEEDLREEVGQLIRWDFLKKGQCRQIRNMNERKGVAETEKTHKEQAKRQTNLHL